MAPLQRIPKTASAGILDLIGTVEEWRAHETETLDQSCEMKYVVYWGRYMTYLTFNVILDQFLGASKHIVLEFFKHLLCPSGAIHH